MEGKKREMEMRRKVRSGVIGHASHCFYSSSLSPVVYCSINLKGGRLRSSGLLIVGSPVKFIPLVHATTGTVHSTGSCIQVVYLTPLHM